MAVRGKQKGSIKVLAAKLGDSSLISGMHMVEGEH